MLKTFVAALSLASGLAGTAGPALAHLFGGIPRA